MSSGKRQPFCLGLNVLSPKQEGALVLDDIYIRIFMDENVSIIHNSIEVCFWVLIDNKLALIWMIAWHRRGDQSLSVQMLLEKKIEFRTPFPGMYSMEKVNCRPLLLPLHRFTPRFGSF